MMQNNKQLRICLIAMILILAINMAGCTTEKMTKEVSEEIKNEPVTLKLLLIQPLSDEQYDTLLVEPLRKKYSHITLERLSGTLENTIAAGIIPDLLTHWNGGASLFLQFNLLDDITSLTNKHGVNLDRFEPVTLDAIRSLSDLGELYGLPYSMQFNALYYNQDIFNKFGVGYPQDGMTWDDAIELAKKLTLKDGDVQYRGLSYEHIERLAFPLSPDFVNPKTQRANVNNEIWRKVFEMGQRINSIPGNAPSGHNEFLKDKIVAMYGTINLFHLLKEAVNNGLNLGIAQYPSFKEQPDVYGMVDGHYMFISKQSKHKDAAMQVLDTLTSDEVQIESARKFARNSPLKNAETKKQFGAELDYLNGINLQSIFKSRPASAPVFSIYYMNARTILLRKFDEYNKNAKDINTALREAEEEINKKIDELK